MNPTDKMNLQEQDDGTAIVTFDEEAPGNEGSQNAGGDEASRGAGDDPGDGGGGDGDLDGHGDDNADGGKVQEFRREDVVTDADRERLREKRREERHNRKVVQRDKLSQLDRSKSENALLRRQNEELFMRLNQVEKNQSSADVARIDKVMEDAQLRLAWAESKIKEATVAQDGDAMVKAQNILYEQRELLKQLSARKQAFERPKASDTGVPDPSVQRMAAAWLAKRPWYDPNVRDTDSRIAQVIDQELTAEGVDPRTPAYWDELDARLQDRLPHRYESEHNSDTTSTTKRRPPPNMVSGTGRDSGANNTSRPGEIRISRERVQAMKDAGVWNDPVRRNAMIKRYSEFDKTANRRGGSQ